MYTRFMFLLLLIKIRSSKLELFKTIDIYHVLSTFVTQLYYSSIVDHLTSFETLDKLYETFTIDPYNVY